MKLVVCESDYRDKLAYSLKWSIILGSEVDKVGYRHGDSCQPDVALRGCCARDSAGCRIVSIVTVGFVRASAFCAEFRSGRGRRAKSLRPMHDDGSRPRGRIVDLYYSICVVWYASLAQSVERRSHTAV